MTESFLYALFEEARQKIATLRSDGAIHAAWKQNVESIVEEQFRSGEFGWPPLFDFICHHSANQLAALDDCVAFVKSRTPDDRKNQVNSFLLGNSNHQRQWQAARDWDAGLFELHIKALAIRNQSGFIPELDPTISSGKRPDLLLRLGDRQFVIECTVLTTSNEYEKAWSKWLGDLSVDRNKPFTPDKYLELDCKEPQPEYHQVRLYGKVYNKLAKGLDPDNTQLPKELPNVLFISSCDSKSPWSSEGIRWGLDELFADQPIHKRQQPGSVIDTSLDGWLGFTAKECELNSDKYCNDFQALIMAPRRIGGLFVFGRCHLDFARKNYYAEETNNLTHQEVALLEKVFSMDPDWETQHG